MEADNSIAFLSEAIRRVQVTDGFSNILSERQLNGVYIAALDLSAAVAEYLAMVITYFTDKSIR
jgi:tripartite-type tricarboxylate transporter receptor subunit TctC